MKNALHIPPFVNYECQVCGWCCRQYDITLSAVDHKRLSKHNWGNFIPELAGKEWCAPLRDPASPDPYRLRHRPGGGCIFLSEDDKCLMHEHSGEFGKAFACCIYPFTFAGTPTGLYAGLRFSCKAVAYGLGESLVRRGDFVGKQAELCQKAGQVARYGADVDFDGRQTLPWRDYLSLEETLIRVFLRDDMSLARRLFFAFKLIDILQAARLDKVRGAKFTEFVQILEAGLVKETTEDSLPSRPGAMQRVLFRQFCAIFHRRFGGAYRELDWKGKLRRRLRNFWAGIEFTFGLGAPELDAFPGRVPLSRIKTLEVPQLGPDAELALSRFLAGKLFGKQYFGPLFFQYSLVQGLTFLLLAAGAVMWYARARALARGADDLTEEDVIEAVRYVDFCYGPSAAPATVLERTRVRILAHGDAALRAALGQFG